MQEGFTAAVEFVLAHEGGYVNHPSDPGGETKYGISKRSYPDLDIRNLSRDQAIAIYKRDYWDTSGAEKMPPGVGFLVFDHSVNAGRSSAIKLLQRAINVTADGALGPVTLKQANILTPRLTVIELTARRILWYAKLSTFPTFGTGWTRRCCHGEAAALLLT